MGSESPGFAPVGNAYGYLPIIAFAVKAVTIPNGRFTNSKYSVNIGPPIFNPKYPAPLIGRKNKNNAVSGARTYKKPSRYSRFHAVLINSPNKTPHSPPQKSGLYISGDFKETGALTPRAPLSPSPNRMWLKRTTATAPITPAAKQIATSCLLFNALLIA